MHVQSGCSGNDSDVVILPLPSSGSQPTDSPSFLMDVTYLEPNTRFSSNGLGLKLYIHNLPHVPPLATVCGVEKNVNAAGFTPPQNGAIVRTDSVLPMAIYKILKPLSLISFDIFMLSKKCMNSSKLWRWRYLYY